MDIEEQPLLEESSANAVPKRSTKKPDVILENLIKTLINFKKLKKMKLEQFKTYVSEEFDTIHKWRNKEEVDSVKKSKMHNFLKIISSLDFVALLISFYEKEEFRNYLNRWHFNKHIKEAPVNFTGVTCRVNNSHLFYGKDDILSVDGAYCAGPFNIEFSEEIYTYTIESWWNILQDTSLELIRIPKTKKSLYNSIFSIIEETILFLEESKNQAGLSRLVQIFLDSSEEYWLLSAEEIIEFFKNKELILEKLQNMNFELQKVLIITLYSFEQYIKKDSLSSMIDEEKK